MPPQPDTIMEEDSDYASSEDEDFQPDVAPAAVVSDDSSASESEAEDETNASTIKKPKKRKRKGKDVEEAEDVGFENSGDEAIVEKGLKKQKRRKGKGVEDEEETGEGLFVRTRRMAAEAMEERKPLANTDAATVDVDALWASMSTAPIVPNSSTDDTLDSSAAVQDMTKSKPLADAQNDADTMITIKRTYNFAGKVHSESKLVHRDSAEARLYLASLATDSSKSRSKSKDSDNVDSSVISSEDPSLNATELTKPLRPRPLARRSLFEPPPALPLPPRADLHFGEAAVVHNNFLNSTRKEDKGKKLSTVEKSKMDWAGFVDKEGIKDELEVAGKAKGAFLGQREFLARVEAKRDEEERRRRLGGMV